MPQASDINSHCPLSLQRMDSILLESTKPRLLHKFMSDHGRRVTH